MQVRNGIPAICRAEMAPFVAGAKDGAFDDLS
jgi:hypothetical protein